LTVSAILARWFADRLLGEKAIWNSGKHTRCAFFLAASFTKSIDFFRFSCLSSDDRICTTAIFFNHSKEGNKNKNSLLH
jgi:hypothetical protein